jgi:hypothetical protein
MQLCGVGRGRGLVGCCSCQHEEAGQAVSSYAHRTV